MERAMSKYLRAVEAAEDELYELERCHRPLLVRIAWLREFVRAARELARLREGSINVRSSG
jgi:hypothetical protein